MHVFFRHKHTNKQYQSCTQHPTQLNKHGAASCQFPAELFHMSVLLPQYFPLLLPDTRSGTTTASSPSTAYRGFVEVNGQLCAIAFKYHAVSPDSSARIELEDSVDLQSALGSKLYSLLHTRIQQVKDVNAFVIELKDVLDRATPLEVHHHGNSHPLLSNASYYDRLVAELEALGWDKVAYIDDSLSKLQLRVRTGSRTHLIHLSLPFDYPNSPPQVQLPLPQTPPLHWSASHSTLQSLLADSEQILASHNDYMDVLDDFDRHTWVLEPETPTYEVPVRRILVTENVYLRVELLVDSPRSLPMLRLMGADNAVEPLRRRLMSKLGEWNEQMTPRENLQALLQVQFQAKEAAEEQDITIECGICYTYKLGDMCVDRVCDHCRKPFHRVCLFEWLRQLPDSSVSFDVIFGNCPCCDGSISCKRT